jgi:putative serine protease PepD
MGIPLPPPIPGIPPAPPTAPVAPTARRSPWRRAIAVLSLLVAVIGAGAVGVVLGTSVSDQTAEWQRPSNDRVEVATDGAPLPALDVPAVLATIEPSVVTISADVDEDGVAGRAVGTGVVLTADGEILTNAHVVEGATEVRVRFMGETEPRPAVVLAADPGNDLALLRVDIDGLVPAVFAEPGSLQVGEEVVAVGYALGLDGGPSVTRGIISALDRTLLGDDGALDGLVQTDAAISSGNSGGPLVNARGEVVGINTAVYQGDATTAANNVGFAISTDEALPVIEALRAQAGGEPRVEGFLGVGIDDRVDGGQGAIVVEVTEGSPADDAGFRVGDIVLEADGSTIAGSAGLIAAIRDAAPGDEVLVVVERDGELIELTATLVERES